ncbi:MAG: hypothetical protein HY958_07625 [Bacteroidia bacterium]|nr:hypothetical protein [Bacteroidia bacterium]
MKKLFLVIGLLALTNWGFSQNQLGKADDMGRISLTSVVPQQIAGMPKQAESLLKNKLNEITTKNGLGGSATNPQFIITANVAIISKDITPTAPPMIAYNLQITFYVADYVNKVKFSSASIALKGVGTNEEKAYISAIKNINAGAPDIKNCIETGKTKIIEYFNSKCDFIIKEAKTIADQKKFDLAILKLTSVPDVCKECYNKAMDNVKPIYQMFLDDKCNKDLAQARTSWGGSLNYDGAMVAQSYLSGITPDAKCYAEAQELVKEIKAKVFADQKKEWEFALMVYKDGVDLQKQSIEAYRQIGVAAAEHQPSVVYDVSFLW